MYINVKINKMNNLKSVSISNNAKINSRFKSSNTIHLALMFIAFVLITWVIFIFSTI